MSEIERIVEQLEQAHEGGAWHGPSLREALDGVDATTARRRPIAGAHSIWEIVHHVRVNEEGVRSRLSGEPAGEEPDWPTLDGGGEAAWNAERARLEAARKALRRAAASLPAARLHEAMPGKEHSYWYELLGILHHDLYHAGQISLLRKEG